MCFPLFLSSPYPVYVNHRPAFGLSATRLHEAFDVLGLDEYDGAPSIERGELLDLLQTKGNQVSANFGVNTALILAAI